MAIRKIARMGHPVLRGKARELLPDEILSAPIQQLIQDMIETMQEYGGIGLAAPQIHESLQLALIGYSDESERYPGRGSQPLTVFINPLVTVLDPAEQSFWEGCLSIPDLRGLVHRPRKIQVDFLDGDAQPRTIIVENFQATVFQHELDHLDGVLFIDRIKDTRNLAFLEEHERYGAPSD